jgi:RNA polymerase sigma-70 factor, ECF subfamily
VNAPAIAERIARVSSGRLEQLFVTHYAWVWRALRRFGVAESAADDATQQVFLVLSNRLEQVAPGKERAFLTGVALRVAANVRRSARRRRSDPDLSVAERGADGPDPEQLVDLKQRRELLDSWLDSLSLELRAPFVLFELEGLELVEIAALLEVPLGTVKTRLRRARQLFLQNARDTRQGGEP